MTCIYAILVKHDCVPAVADTGTVSMLGEAPSKNTLCSKLFPNLSLSANSVTVKPTGEEKNKAMLSL